MADSSEPAFLFLYRKGAVAPVDYLSTFATAPFFRHDSDNIFHGTIQYGTQLFQGQYRYIFIVLQI